MSVSLEKSKISCRNIRQKSNDELKKNIPVYERFLASLKQTEDVTSSIGNEEDIQFEI